MKQLVLGSMMVMACQSPMETTSQSAQALSPGFCSATVPPVQPWHKGKLPPAPPSTVVVMVNTGAAWRAYGADPSDDKIHWAVDLTANNMAAFMSAISSSPHNTASIRIPPNLPCPPVCGDGGPVIMAAAHRAQFLVEEALADAEACYQ